MSELGLWQAKRWILSHGATAAAEAESDVG
jgi:hypothetical protein